MKSTKFFTALAVCALLAACSSTPEETQTGAQVDERTGAAGRGAFGGAGGAGGAGVGSGVGVGGYGGTGTPIGAGGVGGQGGAGSGAGSISSGFGANTVAPGINAGTLVGGRGDPALRDPRSPLSQRSIYFDYDGFLVGPDYRAMIEVHAQYLVANRGARMRIEGNTDERGSREYNLALGQKRADGVRRALVVLGASESQIETVSFGEEKPRAQGSSEESWRENRRADIAYAGE